MLNNLRCTTILLTFLIAACSADSKDAVSTDTANNASDSGHGDASDSGDGISDISDNGNNSMDTGGNAATDADVTSDTATDTGEPDASCATAPCDEGPLTFGMGEQDFPFSNAAFGMSAPAQSASGEWEIYLEAWEGGFTGCPQANSPTPARTLIVSGLPMLAAVVGYSGDDGVNITLIDYAGDIVTTANPTSRASDLLVRPNTWSLCTECVGEPEPSNEDGEVDLTMMATFEQGTLSGRIVARHCDSLDLP